MTLPPAWKVKREMRRIVENMRISVSSSFDPMRQRHHDRNLARLLRETPGARSLTSRVAVFVLFQPKGIAGSTFLTLDHLKQEGWSVLTISNTPLSDADRSRLAAASGHVIERPNTGYDFGAYREGWRWLDRHDHALDRLILMNDSTWFPLRMDDDSLRRMEALGADLAGQVFKTELANDPSHDHMEAHLLMFGPRALSDPTIRQFWPSYRMTNSRSKTIARGEKGITHAALAAGLTVKGLLGRDSLLEILNLLSDADLLQVVSNLVLDNDAGRERRANWQAAAAACKPWRSDFLAWTAHELANSRKHLLSANFVDPAVRLGGMGFLKKSSDRRFQLARMLMIREIHAGRVPPFDPVVVAEIQASVRNWKQPYGWRLDPKARFKPLEL